MVKSIAEQFAYRSEVVSVLPVGNGHINSTFLVECQNDKYTLQKINHNVFEDVDGLMCNIVRVTEHISKKLAWQGKDDARGTLHVVYTNDGNPYYYDPDKGEYWRSYRFVDDAVALEKIDGADTFYKCAYVLGEFQDLLSDFPIESLNLTIKNFHNTPLRFRAFEQSVSDDRLSRAAGVRREIEFFAEHKDYCGVNTDKITNGALPLRVTHNDTKLNNILFDRKTNQPLCLIDLDTVMPGIAADDFGDAIRSGASRADEDERDLSKVNFDISLFEAFSKGYMRGTKGCLNDEEVYSLADGAILMTLECGMRFLTDYLNGDVYFKTDYPDQNLLRARTHIKMASDMEKQIDEMRRILYTIKK